MRIFSKHHENFDEVWYTMALTPVAVSDQYMCNVAVLTLDIYLFGIEKCGVQQNSRTERESSDHNMIATLPTIASLLLLFKHGGECFVVADRQPGYWRGGKN